MFYRIVDEFDNVIEDFANYEKAFDKTKVLEDNHPHARYTIYRIDTVYFTD